MRALLAAFLLLSMPACGSGTEPLIGGSGVDGGGGAGGAQPDLPPLEVEAGFIEVPSSAGTARMFYAFRPADEHADDAPLFVFFNGGPGAATSAMLLPIGTGPLTLDPDAGADGSLVANEASFARFGNLLYIDARSSGFSYDSGVAPGCRYDLPIAGDAADFIYVLLEVLDDHPALTNNPVVLVGESYGGTRASVMMSGLQQYAAVPVANEVGQYADFAEAAPWLRDRVQAHLDRAFPETAGVALASEEVARQFGTMVLIQPSLAGGDQVAFEQPLREADPVFEDYTALTDVYDAYDVRRTAEEALLFDERMAATMRDAASLEALLGVPLALVTGLAADSRGDAVRDFELYDAAEVAVKESSLRASLGALSEHDAYWLPHVRPCGTFLGDGRTLAAFGDVLERTRVFITNARYDAVVYTPALPLYFDSFNDVSVSFDDSAPAGAERPGLIRFHEPFTASIRFPQYEAGHAVAASASAELAADVEAWLLSEGVLEPQ